MFVRRPRSSSGAQITEFAAAFMLLFFCFFIPFLDLGIMPIRYFLAQQIIGNFARKLSLCETLTQSFEIMNADPSLQTQLIRLGGVNPQNIQLSLIISRTAPPIEQVVVTEPKKIPPSWLPGGANGQCAYVIDLSVMCEISPAILLNFGENHKIPGLSAPVRFPISVQSPWENLGRDPLTKQYFMNE